MIKAIVTVKLIEIPDNSGMAQRALADREGHGAKIFDGEFSGSINDVASRVGSILSMYRTGEGEPS